MKTKFKQTEIGLIPEDWEEKNLQGVTTYINRGVTPVYNKSGNFIAVNQRCIRNGFVNFSNARKIDSKKKINPDKILRIYDILINSTGVGTLGRVAQILDLPGPATVDSHVTIIRPDPEKNRSYVFRLLFKS